MNAWTVAVARSALLALPLLFGPLAPVRAADEAHFACRPTLPGLCLTTYSGPTDAGAAASYLADARVAAEAAVAGHPEVRAVRYDPETGALAVLPEPGRTVSPYALREIASRFVDARLRLERVVVPGGGRALRPGRDRGGRSRFPALSHLLIAPPGARTGGVGAVEVVSYR